MAKTRETAAPTSEASTAAAAAPAAPPSAAAKEPANVAEASAAAAAGLADGEAAEFRFAGQKYVVRREGDAIVAECRGA